MGVRILRGRKGEVCAGFERLLSWVLAISKFRAIVGGEYQWRD